MSTFNCTRILENRRYEFRRMPFTKEPLAVRNVVWYEVATTFPWALLIGAALAAIFAPTSRTAWIAIASLAVVSVILVALGLNKKNIVKFPKDEPEGMSKDKVNSVRRWYTKSIEIPGQATVETIRVVDWLKRNEHLPAEGNMSEQSTYEQATEHAQHMLGMLARAADRDLPKDKK